MLKQILLGILSILNRRERTKLYQLIAFDLVIGLLDIAFLALLLVILNIYTKGTVPVILKLIPASFLNPNSLLLIGGFFVLFSIKNLFGYAGLKTQHHFFYDVASRLSRRNLLNYLSGDYAGFVNIDSSVRIRQISQQPIEFSHYILTNFQQVVSQIILIIFTVCAILFYHPSLFLLLFLLLLPPVVLLGWLTRKKLRAVRANIKKSSEKTLQHVHESLAGYVESNIYDKDAFFTDRYSGYQQQLNENIAAQQTLQSLPSRLVEAFAVLGFLVLIGINKLSGSAPPVNVLTIGVLMTASYKIIPGIVKIMNCTGQMKTYRFTVTDLLTGINVENPKSKNEHQPINNIRFKDISYSYAGNEVLKHVSFNLNSGDMIGLSAQSGKGKTTLINLLLGFLKPDDGRIFINDNLIKDNAYRNRISYVKQQSFFINDTILKNITLSDGDYDSDRLNKALDFTGLNTLLNNYPEKLGKVITENGKNISGGQRQRIMLARALYRDFDLLILDEPFSEMDNESETLILKQLQLLAQQNKMILLVTHNKSSLSFCNKIIVPGGK